MNTLVGARVYVHTLNVNISNGGNFARSGKGEEGIPGLKEKCLPTAPHVNLFFFLFRHVVQASRSLAGDFSLCFVL